MVDWVKALTACGKAWNERDRQARMDLLRDALADYARYTDTEFGGAQPPPQSPLAA